MIGPIVVEIRKAASPRMACVDVCEYVGSYGYMRVWTGRASRAWPRDRWWGRLALRLLLRWEVRRAMARMRRAVRAELRAMGR